jgi:hypothetical protein
LARSQRDRRSSDHAERHLADLTPLRTPIVRNQFYAGVMTKTPRAEYPNSSTLTDWRPLGTGLAAWFDAPSHAAGAALVSRIADLAEDLPDVSLRANGVRVIINTAAPTPLAEEISAAAKALDLTADPAALVQLHLSIETADAAAVMPFWQTALAYDREADNVLVDPLRREPAITFNTQPEPPALRNRTHVDIGRTAQAAETARATMGTPYGPWNLTLADVDGNELDLVPGDELTPETTDWHTLFSAMAFYPTSSSVAVINLATQAAALADAAGIPLLIDLHSTGVTLDSAKDQWETPDGSGAVPDFTALATKLQSAAQALGFIADPTNLRFVQLGIDAADIPAVRSFWLSVLAYTPDPRDFLTDITDPNRLNPVIFFQQLAPTDPPRPNRIHIHLNLPADQVAPRIATAQAAGGKLHTESPESCTLTDPEGNHLHLHWRD